MLTNRQKFCDGASKERRPHWWWQQEGSLLGLDSSTKAKMSATHPVPLDSIHFWVHPKHGNSLVRIFSGLSFGFIQKQGGGGRKCPLLPTPLIFAWPGGMAGGSEMALHFPRQLVGCLEKCRSLCSPSHIL